METHDALADKLVAQSQGLICERGLENYSVRNVAAAAGCSTTAVSRRFQSKADLLQAVQTSAYGEDLEFHRDFADRVAGVPLNFDNFVELVVCYVEARSRFPVARFWSELLLASRQEEVSRDVLNHWYRLRVNFWQNQLSGMPGVADYLPEMITVYTVMEELYAYELCPDIHYRLLLREGVKALLAKSFAVTSGSVDGEISCWLNDGPVVFPQFEKHVASELADTLLGLAAEEIRKKGVSSLSQRSLTRKAGASPAMIAYHFGNMANFTNEALWHVLLHEIPSQFDPNEQPVVKQKDMTEWARVLKRLTRSRSAAGAAGFYGDYARLTGQACLLAARQKALHPLIGHLRQIDGWGTYRSGSTVWPDSLTVRRGSAMAFGIWIKGLAVVHEALSDKASVDERYFRSAAELLF